MWAAMAIACLLIAAASFVWLYLRGGESKGPNLVRSPQDGHSYYRRPNKPVPLPRRVTASTMENPAASMAISPDGKYSRMTTLSPSP